MNPQEMIFTIHELSSLENEVKNTLVGCCKAAFEDELLKKSDADTRSITLAREGGLTYKLVAEREKERKAKTLEEIVRELGLSKEAGRKILKGVQSREYKRYHIADLKYMTDLLQELEPALQKKAIDQIIANRKNYYQANKEELVTFALSAGELNAYNIDLWYGGLIRLLEKLTRRLDVSDAVPASLDPVQKNHLAKLSRKLLKKLSPEQK
jgi:hypothetical protein